jgi:vacuolar-type H+-ATPase subunit E/Vma4
MSIANIINHLEEKHNQRLAELERDHASRLASLEKQWDGRFVEAKQKILSEYQQKSQQKLAQLSFKQREQWQREVLQKKQFLMDDLFNRVWGELKSLSDKDYDILLRKAFTKLPKLDGKIQVAPDGEVICQKIIKDLGRKDELIVNKNFEDRGFIYSNDKVLIDYSFNFVLRQLKNDSVVDLNNSLFE